MVRDLGPKKSIYAMQYGDWCATQRGGPTAVMPIARRTHALLTGIIGPFLSRDAVLHTDGAFAFEQFAQKPGLNHDIANTLLKTFSRVRASIQTTDN